MDGNIYRWKNSLHQIKKGPERVLFYCLNHSAISGIKSQLGADTAPFYTGDLNNISVTSIYYSNGATNQPSGYNGYVSTIVADASYTAQHYTTYFGSDYIRVKNNGTWTSWTRVDTCETSSYSSGANSWVERKHGDGTLEVYGNHTCNSTESAYRGYYGGIYVWDANVELYFNTKFAGDYYFINAYPNSNGYMWYVYRDGSDRNHLSNLSFGANYTGPTMNYVEFYCIGSWR